MFILPSTLSNNISVSLQDNKVKDILKIIAAISYTEEYTETIIIIDVDNVSHKINFEFNANSFIVYDSNCKKPLPKYNKYKGSFLFLVDRPRANIYRYIKRFYRWSNYDIQTPVTIYIPFVKVEEELNYMKWIKNMFKKLWLLNLTRVLVVFWSQITNSMQWFNYHVFLKTVYNQTGIYDLRSNMSAAEKNFYEFPLMVCFYNAVPFSIILNVEDKVLIAGIDGFMMKTILKKINATYQIVKFDSKNGADIPESRQAVIDHRCDVLFTSQYFVDNSKPDLQYLYPVATDEWCIMVRKAGKKIDIFRFIKPFKPRFWIAVICCTSSVIIIWNWYLKQASILLHKEDKKLNWLHVISIFLNVTLSIKMSKLSASTRTMIMSVVIYNITVSYSYLALLFGSLITPIYNEDMHTLDDVNKTGIEIYFLIILTAIRIILSTIL